LTCSVRSPSLPPRTFLPPFAPILARGIQSPRLVPRAIDSSASGASLSSSTRAPCKDRDPSMWLAIFFHSVSPLSPSVPRELKGCGSNSFLKVSSRGFQLHVSRYSHLSVLPASSFFGFYGMFDLVLPFGNRLDSSTLTCSRRDVYKLPNPDTFSPRQFFCFVLRVKPPAFRENFPCVRLGFDDKSS